MHPDISIVLVLVWVVGALLGWGLARLEFGMIPSFVLILIYALITGFYLIYPVYSQLSKEVS